MIFSIFSCFKHFWRRQYLYFLPVNIFEILLFNEDFIFIFCCFFQEFSWMLKAIDWETRNTPQNKQVVLLRIVIFNQSVTIGCQCRSELMVLRYNCWTQIHGPYGQSIRREDIDKLCCLINTWNIENNYVKLILSDTPKHVQVVSVLSIMLFVCF